MSSSTGKDPASIHPGLKSLDYLNPKLGSVYFRMHQGEGLRYMSTEAFLAWKSLPSTDSDDNRPFYVFLHDYGSSARIFNKIVSEIKNHCVAMDLRGWGRSDYTRDESPRAYSVIQMRNDILRIVNLLQGEKFILVGHGMGAKVAQLYAAQQPPENLLGLVLLAPIPLSSWRPPARILAKYKAAYQTGGNLENFVRDILAHAPVDETDIRNLVDDGMKDTPLAKEAWLSYGLDEDFSSAIGRINVPVMVRVGEVDRIIKVEDVVREISTKMHVCIHLLANDRGHLIPVEDDELETVLDWFGRDAEDLKVGRPIDLEVRH